MDSLTLSTPGVCRICGCSEAFACESGCSWADATRTICSRCAGGPLLRRLPSPATYELLPGERPAIRCLRCGLVSHHPSDVQERYCGRCGRFHEE